jgi:uncharacterized protein
MRTAMLTLLRPLALVLMLLPAAPASAQAPDAVAAAKDLMTVMHSADNFKAMMPAIMDTLKPAIVQGRPDVARDYDAFMPVLLGAMTSRLDEMIDKIAAIYARKFSAAELSEVANFYRGPTGQKFVQQLPAIMQESMALGQSFGQQLASEMQQRMLDELRKKGHKI